MANTPAWLTARPIAHRGLHAPVLGLIENTIPAFDAAVERGFAIELDVQLTADGDAVVFHDDALDRLTLHSGAVIAHTRAQLATIPVTGSGGTIASLAQVLAHVDGRAPLIIELKSRFDGDVRLADAVAGALAAYGGPAALMSFDPALVTSLRRHRTGRPLGIVAASMFYRHWGGLSPWRRLLLGNLLHGPGFWCDFISYRADDLPGLAPLLARWLGRKAVICWTVRTPDAARRAMRHAHAITFEGFDPHGTLP